jgi:hypothetical protein
VNTTAHLEDAPAYGANALKSRVFEFTPLHYGCDYFGYHRCEFPIDYNRAIAISGAAVDSKDFANEAASRQLASAFNADLGYFINNPATNITTARRSLRRLLPFPLYPFDGHYQRDLNGDRIYLADGGHAENLGAYSLVRRLCESMIIVDAEFDPCFEFEGYRRLQEALRSEMGVDFRVNAIEQAIKTGKFLADNPVMEGTISYFPVKRPTAARIEKRTLHVAYIKLSLDASKPELYSDAIRKYHAEHRCDRTSNGKPNGFPQHSTADQSFTPDQVQAYHDLGRFMVTNYQAKLFQALKLRP